MNGKAKIALITSIGLPLLGWILFNLVEIPKTYATKDDLRRAEETVSACQETMHNVELRTERMDVILQQMADREGIPYR